LICSRCGREDARTAGSFGAVCEGCGCYLHTCDQCRLYDVSSRLCASSTAEQPGDPGHKNFCEEFEPYDRLRGDSGKTGSSDAGQRFTDLFGGR
jgi:hypothetical protein